MPDCLFYSLCFIVCVLLCLVVRSEDKVPKHARTNKMGVADLTDRLVVSLSLYGGVAVVTLRSNVLSRLRMAGPFEKYLRSRDIV